MNLRIKDIPGRIPVHTMRHYFEGAVASTPAFASNTPLGQVTINGEFSHYADADTDTMWLGFALGMRCAERIDAVKAQRAAAPAIDDVPLLRSALDVLQRYSRWAADMGTELDAENAIRDLKARLNKPSATDPSAAGRPLENQMTQTDDHDAWQCDRCHGEGWHWVEREGVEWRDIVRTKEHCEECDGLGWLGPDAAQAKASVTPSAALPSQAQPAPSRRQALSPWP